MQKSRSFLVPILKFTKLVTQHIANSYIGNSDYEGLEWGNYLYIEINSSDLDSFVLSELRNHPQYITELDEKYSVLFVYEFTQEQKQTIVIPFTGGQYSKISRKYVQENFPKFITDKETKEQKVSLNWRILNKDIWQISHDVVPLRVYWKARIGEELELDAEVWPKPKKELEIFNYFNEVLQQEIQECSKPVVSPKS